MLERCDRIDHAEHEKFISREPQAHFCRVPDFDRFESEVDSDDMSITPMLLAIFLRSYDVRSFTLTKQF